MLLDADGFAGLVVDEVDLRQLHEHRLPSRSSNFVLMLLPMTCSGGMPYTAPSTAHELDAAAGDDEGLEAVRPQIGQHFEHRLVDHLREGAPSSGARGGDPVGDDLLELLGRHPGVRGHRHFKQGVLAAGEPFHVAFSTEANGSFFFHSGMLRRRAP